MDTIEFSGKTMSNSTHKNQDNGNAGEERNLPAHLILPRPIISAGEDIVGP